MSENYYQVQCLADAPEQLTRLLAALQQAREQGADTPPPALLEPLLANWDQPVVQAPALYGNLLAFTLVTSSHDLLDKSRVQALHTLGADYVRIHADYTQVGESALLCYHKGRKIAAKAFPEPLLDDAGRAFVLLQEQDDAPLAALVKAGLDPDLVIDGQPLLIHACRHHLGKTLAALLQHRARLSICQPWPELVVQGISALGKAKDRRALLQGLIDSGAELDAIWRASEGFYRDPALMAVLLAAGADVDQPLSESQGSLLYHSVELFTDQPAILALLSRHGARAVPPMHQTLPQRLQRLLNGWRGAEPLAQLLADGLDPNARTEGEPAALAALLHKPSVALGLLQAGADTSAWLEPAFFQKQVLYPLSFHHTPPWQPDAANLAEAEATLGLLRLLLARGLDANMPCRTLVYFESSSCFTFSGPLCMLALLVCCAPDNRWATQRLALAQAFIDAGADLNALGGRTTGVYEAPRLSVRLGREWVDRFTAAGQGSLLHHLQQQEQEQEQEQHPHPPGDDTRALQQLLQSHGGRAARG